MNDLLTHSQIRRYAAKSLLIAGVLLTVVAGSARPSSAQCCGWGWNWSNLHCCRPCGCYQPVCPCQPVCGCQPSCCPGLCGSCCGSSCCGSSCGGCSSCTAPACGTCGPAGCGVSYRVGPGSTLAWNGSISQAFAQPNRRSVPATTTRVSAPAYRRANSQTADVYHAPRRSRTDFVARRDYGATEQPIASAAPDSLPISMTEGSSLY